MEKVEEDQSSLPDLTDPGLWIKRAGLPQWLTVFPRVARAHMLFCKSELPLLHLKGYNSRP